MLSGHSDHECDIIRRESTDSLFSCLTAMKFEDYYKEFCEVFGHPLWMIPMMTIGIFLMIEVLHTNEHYNQETGDAHGYCGRKEWVKKLQGDQW